MSTTDSFLSRNIASTCKAALRAYRGLRRFFARLRPQFSRAIRKAALRAYRGLRRFFARLRPQFSRAIRKAALCAYRGLRRFFAHIQALTP